MRLLKLIALLGIVLLQVLLVRSGVIRHRAINKTPSHKGRTLSHEHTAPARKMV
jgi:hypothetical protein